MFSYFPGFYMITLPTYVSFAYWCDFQVLHIKSCRYRIYSYKNVCEIADLGFTQQDNAKNTKRSQSRMVQTDRKTLNVTTLLQPVWAEKHVKTGSRWTTTAVDRSGSSIVNQEQESEATVGTDSPKLDRRGSFQSCGHIFLQGSGVPNKTSTACR